MKVVMDLLVVKAPAAMPDAPKRTTKQHDICMVMMHHSNTRRSSPSQNRAIIAVIRGPMLANKLITRSEMYFVLAVLIMFDQEL
jgi:hypothetical protein